MGSIGEDAGSAEADSGSADSEATPQALPPSPFVLSGVTVRPDTTFNPRYFDVSLTIQNTGTVDAPFLPQDLYVNVGHGVLVSETTNSNLPDYCLFGLILLPGGTYSCTGTFGLDHFPQGTISELRYEAPDAQPVVVAVTP